MTSNDVIDELEEMTAVRIVAEDGLASDAPGHHVVDAAGDLETWRTSHVAKVVPPGPHQLVGATFVTMS